MKKEKILRLDLFFGGIIEIIITIIFIEIKFISDTAAVALVFGGIGLIYASSVSRRVLRFE